MKSRLNTYLSFYKLNQAELAEATNINRNTIGRYCNDTFERIDKNHIDALCSFFRVPFEALFEINYNFPIKYPSPIIEQSIKNIPVPQNLVITTGVNLKTMQEEIITYIKPDEFEDPTSSMSQEELEEVKKISSEYQIRFEKELKIDKMVSTFISKIIQAYLSLFGGTEAMLMIFQDHEKYDYFTTEFKIKKYNRILHPFLTKYSKDVVLLDLLFNINRIYTNGGLDKLSDKELDDLYNSLDYYLANGFNIKKD
jgi:putative transcriptional regulator